MSKLNMQSNPLLELPKPELDKAQRVGFPWTEESDTYANSNIFFPKITIITPSYNQGQYLEETIRSVLLQNYPNLEYIVIDGGSKDNSIDILNKYSQWITYWVSERDKGTYEAINKGLSKMTGDYWCVLNSDDIFLKNAVNNIVNFLGENKEINWVTGDTPSINEYSEVKHVFNVELPTKKVANLSFLESCWIRHPSTFLSKKIFDEIGYFSPIDMLDYDYWIKMELKGYYPSIVSKQIAALRYHNSCKSIDFEKALSQNINLLDSYRDTKIFSQAKPRAEIKAKMTEIDNFLQQTSIKRNIYQGNIFDAFSLWIKLFLLRPQLSMKRWFWGLFVRLFTKDVKEAEFNPFLFLNS